MPNKGFLSGLAYWWRWRMRRGRVHVFGIAEYRGTGTIVGHADSQWRLEDEQGRVFYAPEQESNIPGLKVGDRVEFEPMFQSTAATRVTNRQWKIVHKWEPELAQAVLQVAQHRSTLEPVTQAALDSVERRFGITLPADMIRFYRFMNGMDWPTEPSRGWLRVWRLEEWRRVSEQPELRDDSKYEALSNAIIFSDYCDESWWYAAEFVGQGSEVRILEIGGPRPALVVATGFTAFIQAALAGGPDIYADS